MDTTEIVTFDRIIKGMEGGFYVIGEGKFKETRYLHADGQWRKMAAIDTLEGRKFSGRFSSKREAEKVLEKVQGGGFSQMAQAFERVQFKR